uniref:Uncharacterized protein n=1 Tax=Romanomermis culicivorax TaxID=13658 RepID=A0A915L2H1_ROMCU
MNMGKRKPCVSTIIWTENHHLMGSFREADKKNNMFLLCLVASFNDVQVWLIGSLGTFGNINLQIFIYMQKTPFLTPKRILSISNLSLGQWSDRNCFKKELLENLRESVFSKILLQTSTFDF